MVFGGGGGGGGGGEVQFLYLSDVDVRTRRKLLARCVE